MQAESDFPEKRTKDIIALKKHILLSFSLITLLSAYSQELPCAGYDLRSDEFYFRGSGSGRDSDSINARRKAILMARQRISTQIEITVNSVTEIYVQTLTATESSETLCYIRSIVTTLSKKLLIGSKIICENITYNTADNEYVSSVAVELPIANIVDAFSNEKDKNITWNIYGDILKNEIRSKQ